MKKRNRKKISFNCFFLLKDCVNLNSELLWKKQNMSFINYLFTILIINFKNCWARKDARHPFKEDLVY